MKQVMQKQTASSDVPQIEMHNVTKIYGRGTDDEYLALKDVDLSIEKGEYISIIGSSGSGKSTLMRIIGCQEKPTDGQYCLRGKDIKSCSQKELAKLKHGRIAVIPQQYGLVKSLSVWQNVAKPLSPNRFSHAERKRRADRALRSVGLADKANLYPEKLSGGQQQRVAIARAMVQRPDIVLADEPTAALDIETKEYVMTIFQKINAQGVTVILITHDPSVAVRAHRLIQVADGTIQQDRLLPCAS